ncbi:hypothetical protein AKJ65_03240 [candidate division MSBL1 archaeon SCGC-AAA259E19]|uniref:Uncharacterized protein n=1 Tax=candidate division MSBL1 archaeon SCGC-AAA259E19 TaxID=1698264 RepID=A0A133UKY4_9EURY|nr:hypothetical protein AKJ65_03240 [candidate division MSBL1 archaeon SCGC-AAA259E19]
MVRKRGISSSMIVVVVAILVGVSIGSYFVVKGDFFEEGKNYDRLEEGEALITENVVELGLRFNEIKEYFDNIESYKTRYTTSAKERAGWTTGASEEEFQEVGFVEAYSILVRHYKTLFSFESEKELTEGRVSEYLVDKFRSRGYSLPENAFIAMTKDEWVIYLRNNKNSKTLFRIQQDKDRLTVKEANLSISIYSDLNRFDSVRGADKNYESFHEEMVKMWKKHYDYDPQSKAVKNYKTRVSESKWKKVIENGRFAICDDSFARYYKHISQGKPGFGITFRERNIAGGIFIGGDIPQISRKGIKLAKILEKRLE